eukprot:gene10831-14521_t
MADADAEALAAEQAREQANTGTKDVAETHRFDEGSLLRWLQAVPIEPPAMEPVLPSTSDTVKILRARWFNNPNLESIPALNELLRLMGRWRATVLANTYVKLHGKVVYSGPFEGMEYLASAAVRSGTAPARGS